MPSIVYHFGDWEYCPDGAFIKNQNKKIDLKDKQQNDFLRLLAEAGGEPVSYERIASCIYPALHEGPAATESIARCWKAPEQLPAEAFDLFSNRCHADLDEYLKSLQDGTADLKSKINSFVLTLRRWIEDTDKTLIHNVQKIGYQMGDGKLWSDYEGLLARAKPHEFRARLLPHLCRNGKLRLIFCCNEGWLQSDHSLEIDPADPASAERQGGAGTPLFTGISDAVGGAELTRFLTVHGIEVVPESSSDFRIDSLNPGGDTSDILWIGSLLGDEKLTTVVEKLVDSPVFEFKKNRQGADAQVVRRDNQTSVPNTRPTSLWAKGKMEYAILLVTKTEDGRKFWNIAGSDTRANKAVIRMLCDRHGTSDTQQKQQEVLAELVTRLDQRKPVEAILEVRITSNDPRVTRIVG